LLEPAELVCASTNVVIVIMFPSERVEITREMREAEASLVVEVANSEVVEVSDAVVWVMVDGVEELDEDYEREQFEKVKLVHTPTRLRLSKG
jgi:hypothetical protein